MTKFAELSEAYAAAVKRGRQYETDSREFFARLTRVFSDYLGSEAPPFQLEPVLSKPKENVGYGLPGAMELGQDGYWHVGLVLTIRAAVIPPLFKLVLHLMWKGLPDGAGFIVKVDPELNEHRVESSRLESGLQRIAEELFKAIKNALDSDLDRALTVGTTRRIGF